MKESVRGKPRMSRRAYYPLGMLESISHPVILILSANAHANGRRYAVPFSGLFGIVCYRIPSFCRTFSTMVYACLLMIFFPWATHAKA